MRAGRQRCEDSGVLALKLGLLVIAAHVRRIARLCFWIPLVLARLRDWRFIVVGVVFLFGSSAGGRDACVGAAEGDVAAAGDEDVLRHEPKRRWGVVKRGGGGGGGVVIASVAAAGDEGFWGLNADELLGNHCEIPHQRQGIHICVRSVRANKELEKRIVIAFKIRLLLFLLLSTSPLVARRP